MRIPVIDSHTGGEPTRVVPEGAVPLAGATMAERRADLAASFDARWRGIVREPRGSDVLVGAALTPPITPGATCGVVFFTTVGTLGMCGHGTIGVVETLRHLGRVVPGPVVLDTPVGVIRANLNEDGTVALANVRSHRHLADVELTVEGLGTVVGDVAWGGNWFFIVKRPTFEVGLPHAEGLTADARRIVRALAFRGIRGADGAPIDHVELFGAEAPEGADSANFVLCPGGDYDRSPCGTGTSAKLACLHADGKLAPGEAYRQMGMTGSVFTGSVEPVEGGVVPTIVGRAHITAETTLILADDDPLRNGI